MTKHHELRRKPSQNTSMHKWITVNSSSPSNSDNEMLEPLYTEPYDEEISPLASKHRAAILKSAFRFPIKPPPPPPTPPNRKRISSHDPRKTTKRPRSIPTKAKTSLTASKTIGTKSSKEANVIYTKRAEPVKRYLQPTKMSNLNKPMKTRAAAAKLKHSDENRLRTKSIAHSIHQKVPAINNEPPQPAPSQSADVPGFAAYESSKMSIDTVHIGDHDRTSNSSDDETISCTSPPVKASPTLEQHVSSQTSHAPDSRASVHVSTTIDRTQVSSRSRHLQPFLRQTQTESIEITKYSPIPSLTPCLKIPTCFRVAEAVKFLKLQPSNGGMTNQPTTIELFAMIVSVSTDVGTNKNVTALCLADIFFPTKPPYVIASFAKRSNNNASTVLAKKMPTVQGKFGESDCTPYRAIIRRLPPPVDNTLHKVRSLYPSQDCVTAYHHVQVEALAESSWQEVKRVQAIVDPEGAEMQTETRSLKE